MMQRIIASFGKILTVTCSSIYILLICAAAVQPAKAEIINDISRLNATEVSTVVSVKSIEDIKVTLALARAQKKLISISAKRHSQGGHIATQDAIVLDMRAFNKILRFIPHEKSITVEAGITWSDIQRHINPYGLSIKVMQSSNIFSVGGSISANIHGRDPNYGSMAETVLSMTVVLSDGRVMTVSPKRHPELFRAVLGGFGTIAVISDVTLSLTDNVLLKKTVKRLDYKDYLKTFRSDVNSNLALHYGRCSIARNETLLKDCVLVNYYKQGQEITRDALVQEENIARDRFLFGLSRRFEWAKHLRWWLQLQWIDNPEETLLISRNNAMRPPISFLEFKSEYSTDILQEYFVAPDQFVAFMDGFRELVRSEEINLLSMTIRHVKKSPSVFLDYADAERLAIVIYVNIGLDQTSVMRAERWTQQLVEMCLNQGGVYYLTYQRFPSVSQFRRAYPGWHLFKKAKQRFDVLGLLQNRFYQQYLQ